jgi:hypothetical protein
MKPASVLLLAGLLAAPAVAAQAQAAHPDLTGTWTVAGYSASLKPVDGKAPPLKPEAKAVYDQHLAAAAKGDRSFDETTLCLPEGLPRLMVGKEPFEIMQRDKAVYFVAQNRLPWRAYFGEQLPTDEDPLYLGFSVAKWDGSALVVDSAGFRDGTLLDDAGLPHSDALRLTSRYRLGADGKTMTVTFTIDDPKTYTRPWTARATYVKKPANWQMPEEVCAAKLKSTAPVAPKT